MVSQNETIVFQPSIFRWKFAIEVEALLEKNWNDGTGNMLSTLELGNFEEFFPEEN